MARLSRLCLPGHAHWVIQRGHSGRSVFADEADRRAYRAALHEAAATEHVKVHALALLDTEVQLLLTPDTATALSRLMQAVGRRYVSAHHRRHGGSGTLWEGRFRCAPVEPGATLLDVLCLIDGQPAEAEGSSLTHRAAGVMDALVTDPAEYWQLGNTPFDRQAAWRHRVAEGVPAGRASAWRQAALGGWAIGSPAFAAQAAAQAARPAQPRARGRPRRTRAGNERSGG